MKPFKQYVKDKDKKEIPFLSWESSHAEIRNKKKKEKKNNSDKKTIKEDWHGKYSGDDFTHANDRGARYDGKFHEDPDIEPQNITQDHKSAIFNYTSAISGDGTSVRLNRYLRNRAGESGSYVKGMQDGDEPYIKKAIHHLSSAFTKENTNKKHIVTYGGIPTRIGKKLNESNIGDEHHLSGFTSTSSSQHTAKNFAWDYVKDNEPFHIIRYNIHPGAGLSVVKHSRHPENEVILHHGARVTYKGTNIHDDGVHRVHLHDVDVHADHKPLDQYDEYKHEPIT